MDIIIIVSSNLCLPSLHAFLCYIVETVDVIQWAGQCKKGTLHHVCGIFCCQTALTRGVSFEVLHFCSLLHVNPVRSWFRHLHVVHGLSYPLARLSHRLTVTLCGVVCNLLSHSLHRMNLGDNSAGFTLRMKQLWDFSLLSAGCCPYREWASLVSCLVFYILAHTSLRMSGSAIPASKYRSSTLVGFTHPVTALHALFSSVFSFWAWGDLAQTGAAYSATA